MIPGLTSAYESFCQNVGEPQQIANNAFVTIRQSYEWLDTKVVDITNAILPEHVAQPLAQFTKDILHTAPVIFAHQTLPFGVPTICLVVFNIFSRVNPDNVSRELSYSVYKGLFYSNTVSCVINLSSMNPVGFIAAAVSLLFAGYFFSCAQTYAQPQEVV